MEVGSYHACRSLHACSLPCKFACKGTRMGPGSHQSAELGSRASCEPIRKSLSRADWRRRPSISERGFSDWSRARLSRPPLATRNSSHPKIPSEGAETGLGCSRPGQAKRVWGGPYQDGGRVQAGQLVQRPQHRHRSRGSNRRSRGARWTFKGISGPPLAPRMRRRPSEGAWRPLVPPLRMT